LAVARLTAPVLRQSGAVRFADHLRTWSPEALSELMTARPDLLPATDRGFEAVAKKAATPMSLGRCLVRSDVAMLVVAEALAVASPATPDEIDAFLGTGDVDAVLDAIVRLQRRGVVVVDDSVVTTVGVLGDLFHRPLGLGPSFVELAEHLAPEVIDELAARVGAVGASRRSTTARAIARRLCEPWGLAAALEGAPPESRDLIEALAAQRSPALRLPSGLLNWSTPGDATVSWLLGHGLLVAVSDGVAELPREIVIAAHPNGLAPGAALRPVPLRVVTGLAADAVAATAADQAGRALDAAEALLGLAGDSEIVLRKAGGVGVRELRRLAKQLELDARDVGRFLELLYHAHLVRPSGAVLTATDLAPVWRDLPRHRRWSVLVRAWLAAPTFLSRALSVDEDGRSLPALGGVEPVAAAFAGRQIVLDLVGSVDGGAAYDPDQLAEAVVWRSPNLWGAGYPPPERLVRWTIDEAILLGLVALNAPAPTLLALLRHGDDAMERAAAADLGTDQKQLVLQSDLTAIALGPLAPAVAGRLADMADRRPGLTVPTFRFTEASLRRAFDRGWDAASIAQFLADHALSGVPQPLRYLVADIDRRYGSVRVLPARSVVVADDEATAIEIASRVRAARLGLRLVAPTVLVGPIDPHQMVDELRAEGLFPVLDGETVSIRRRPGAGAADGGGGASGGLPADWTGPSLSEAVLPGEVAEAVGLLRDHDDGPPVQSNLDRQLQLLRNRPAVVKHLRDGGIVEARGVLVDVGESVTLLGSTGVEELPLDAVVAVEDPTR
jgi:hypothetical protein